MLDDSPEVLMMNYGNHVPVTRFEGDASDTELNDVLPFLYYLRDQQNVRNVEKRQWRLDQY